MSLPIEKVLFHPLVTGLGSTVLTLAACYYLIGRDLSYIKGQLSQIIDVVKDYRRLREAYLLQGKDVEKIKADLDAAHSKLRSLFQTLQQ